MKKSGKMVNFNKQNFNKMPKYKTCLPNSCPKFFFKVKSLIKKVAGSVAQLNSIIKAYYLLCIYHY